MKYYIIAGEASGDLHGAFLIQSLKKQDPDAKIYFWGGEKMARYGGTPRKHIRDLAFMGFVEVVRHLPTIMRNFSFCKRDILSFDPDVLILIDYPGFNLRIAEWAHQKRFKVGYYISPQIWAWKTGRIKKIQQFVDKMLVILPFERDFYAGHNMEVDFVGHPLVQALETYDFDEGFLQQYGFDQRPILALLPGSRKQEVLTMLPLMLQATEKQTDVQIAIAQAPSLDKDVYMRMIGEKKIKLIDNQTYDLLRHSHAALVTSGTATLETALLRVPQLVMYKGSWLSYHIAKKIIKVKYISLVNLILDTQAVPELIQANTQKRIVSDHLDLILNEDNRRKMLASYDQLIALLHGSDTSDRVAEKMITLAKSRVSESN